MMLRRPWAWLWLAAAMLLLACAAPVAQPAGDRPVGGEQRAQAPKRLRVGIIQEPRGWMPWGGTSTAGGAQNPLWMTTRTLTIIAGDGTIKPVLAEALPTLEQGTWRIDPDGTMEQTWKIRGNAKWHDGQPVTANDFVFAREIIANPGIPTTAVDARDLIVSASAPNPQMLVLRFKGTSPLAEQMLYDPYPQHILGDALASGDLDRFVNHEYWTTGYVATGPYRLTEWQPGAFMELAAFPDYVEGKPKIDTITVRFLADPNTLLANIIGDEVDAALPDGISVDMAKDLQQGWAAPGTGNTALLNFDGRVFRLHFQHRPEYARPAASRDPRVRRALYHTLDKDGINEVELAGLGRPAESWIPPDDPRLPQFRDAIPAWSRDFALAQRILEEAGWQRGSDGVLVHTATGQRMETEIRVTPSQGHAKALAVMADGWRQVGAVVTETVISRNLLTEGEYRATLPFAGLYGHTIGLRWEIQHYGCARAARPENRWTGAHAGYCNPAIQPLIDRIMVTIPDAERTSVQVEVMRAVLKEDHAELPLYWQVTPHVFAKGISGIGNLSPGRHGNAWSPWNVHLWDRT
jgi:peptide/nickel transport system substrate-binding protein